MRQFELPVLTLLLVGILAGCGPGMDELGQSQQGIVHRRYVFVHGASQGGWVWEDVAQHLRDEGEKVSIAYLPAHDTDPTPAVNATLDGYVAAVAAAVHDGGSLPVHLIGHSLGGLVISQFAELEPSTVHDLIYLAGDLPTDGQSALDLFDPNSYVIPYVYSNPEEYTISVPTEQIGPGFCADCSASELAELQGRWRAEPVLPLFTPVHLSAAKFGSVTKKYLFTLQDRTITYGYQQVMASTVTMAKTATINSSHQPQLSRASQLADALKDLAK